MSMTDPAPQMKPQDTVIYLLGELKGEMKATRETVASAQNAQAELNSAHEREHVEFRNTMSELSTGLAVVQAKVTPKTPWYTIATGLGAIVALVIGGIALLNVINPQ